MSDLVKTLVMVAIAAVLGAIAWISTPSPPQLDHFSDQGEGFYPDFTDPLSAASLEVIDYDDASGSYRPFKVDFEDGRWSIPSHYGYPADGEDRLARTAAAVIDLRKDVVQSDRAQDHEALGVIDPLDETTATLKGRGERVTLRDGSGSVLADFVFGKPASGRDGFRYVRLPGKKRTYACKVDVDVSTRFSDWIQTNLLDLSTPDVTHLEINDYSIDEATGRVNPVNNLHLAKDEGGAWTLQELPAGSELDAAKVTTMLSSLSGITITGVRPKPMSLSADLRTEQGIKLDLPTQMSLQSKGFFFSREGRLLSNEGEVKIGTGQGVHYVLRFGEILIGEGLAVSAGTGGEDDAAGAETGTGEEGSQEDGPLGGVENRYLFVTASFDASLLPPKPTPPPDTEPTAVGAEGEREGTGDAGAEGEGEGAGDAGTEGEGEGAGDAGTETDEEAAARRAADEAQRQIAQDEYATACIEWEAAVEEGQELARQLNDRFAPWYYVISAGDFENIRLDLDQLTKPPASTPAGG